MVWPVVALVAVVSVAQVALAWYWLGASPQWCTASPHRSWGEACTHWSDSRHRCRWTAHSGPNDDGIHQCQCYAVFVDSTVMWLPPK